MPPSTLRRALKITAHTWCIGTVSPVQHSFTYFLCHATLTSYMLAHRHTVLPVGSRGRWTSCVHRLPCHSFAVCLALGSCCILHPPPRHPGCWHTPPPCCAGPPHMELNTGGDRGRGGYVSCCLNGPFTICGSVNAGLLLVTDYLCVCILTGLHSDRISHWLQIFSWQLDLVTGLSDNPHRSGSTITKVSVPLAWTWETWRQMTWRCWVPGPHLLLHSDHSPTSQLWANHTDIRRDKQKPICAAQIQICLPLWLLKFQFCNLLLLLHSQ